MACQVRYYACSYYLIPISGALHKQMKRNHCWYFILPCHWAPIAHHPPIEDFWIQVVLFYPDLYNWQSAKKKKKKRMKLHSRMRKLHVTYSSRLESTKIFLRTELVNLTKASDFQLSQYTKLASELKHIVNTQICRQNLPHQIPLGMRHDSQDAFPSQS
jgi:hypothetical protein